MLSFNVVSSVTPKQVSFWSKELPVHGVGESVEAAEEDFLDAVVDYADAWFEELRYAPNHRAFGNLVRRVMSYEGDRDGLRRAVFARRLPSKITPP